MDGMLSQDEINALLNGMMEGGDDSSDTSTSDAGAAESAAPASGSSGGGSKADQSLLSDIEKDAIGEVANISMGTSATTLYSLVNQKVNITTPVVMLATWDEIVEDYERPCVFIRIKYTVGLEGTNILVLKEDDVKIITDLMMGGDGTNTDGELGELHLSAISEAMNQMMGSSATSLSSMLGKMIDISPPEATRVEMENLDVGDVDSFLNSTFVKITFRMQIGELIDSKIMQLYPIDFAKDLYNYFMSSQEPPEPEPAPAPAAAPEPAPAPAPMPGMQQPAMDPSMQQGMGMGMGMGQPMMGQPMMGQPMMGQPMMGQPMMGQPMMGQQAAVPNLNIQPASFQAFSNDVNAMQSQENISLIKDVPLEVTVELGRTSKSISDILDFAPGTIIELDRIAGEPVDVLVNGKMVARGEVVVIEENFGVRVTEIIN
ncbi:MAG: flagellar motor switch phosphatase FliY [Lachnospiraceae bacterium]|nr:flagellar motor switch phosphatase FliY [Lachnospiraceae bacterium]